MRRSVVLVLFALSVARSARAQVSDADLDAHLQARREFDACMEGRLAAMRDAMANPDVDARNAAIRAIPICIEPDGVPLPPIAAGTAAPPSLASPAEPARPLEPVRVKRDYRPYVAAANIGGALLTGVGLAVDSRLAIAGAGVFTIASPAVHYYFGAKDAVVPSAFLHAAGAGLAIYVATSVHRPECDKEKDFACIGNALDSMEFAFKLAIGATTTAVLITAIDAKFLAKPRDVYVTPTFAPSQGTAGLSLGGTF